MRKVLIIFFSFVFACMLSILPLPLLAIPLNPDWCMITLLFWNYTQPRWVSVGVAWCVGILVDSVTGGLLGLHALSFVLTVYFFDMFYRRFHMFFLLQQSVVIGLCVALNFILTACAAALFTDTVILWSCSWSALTSAVCWPFYLRIGQKLHLLRS